ncbi:hypothetical protein HYQ46_005508 [Verticillium longisporum]|nr:hypothetical protein HYQ46_005508 [Verticillium longisporum]
MISIKLSHLAPKDHMLASMACIQITIVLFDHHHSPEMIDELRTYVYRTQCTRTRQGARALDKGARALDKGARALGKVHAHSARCTRTRQAARALDKVHAHSARVHAHSTLLCLVDVPSACLCTRLNAFIYP